MGQYLIGLPVQKVLFAFQALFFLGVIVLSSRPRWLVRFLFICALSLTGYVVHKVVQYESPPSNYCHYYLGAKYRVDYMDFYKVVLAGRGDPLISFRDLSSYRLANNNALEADKYLTALLDHFGVPYPPDADTAALMRICSRSDLFRKHGQEVLSGAGFSAERQKQFREDLKSTTVNIRDCGFNGSPFYILLRQLDPTLHFPLSINSFRVSVFVELALLALSGVLLAKVFHLGTTGMLMNYIIILASWEFYNWVIPGLPGMLWFLPFAGALFFLSRKRYAIAGIMCAACALLKIFPVLLLLPALVSLVVGKARKEPVLREGKEVTFIVATIVAGLVFAAVSQAQMDWIEWVGKIRAQFASGAFFAPNDISFYKTWHHGTSDAIGFRPVGPAVVWAARALLVAFLVNLFRRRRDGYALALGAVASLTMMPWISFEYLQYYSFPIALTLVFLYQHKRAYFSILMLLLLVNQVIADFPEPAYTDHIHFLVWPKTLYYYAAPLFFLWSLRRASSSASSLRVPGRSS